MIHKGSRALRRYSLKVSIQSVFASLFQSFKAATKKWKIEIQNWARLFYFLYIARSRVSRSCRRLFSFFSTLKRGFCSAFDRCQLIGRLVWKKLKWKLRYNSKYSFRIFPLAKIWSDHRQTQSVVEVFAWLIIELSAYIPVCIWPRQTDSLPLPSTILASSLCVWWWFTVLRFPKTTGSLSPLGHFLNWCYFY